MPRPSRPETDRRAVASRQRALARTTGPRASAPGAPAAVVGAAEPADELELAVRTARRAAATRAPAWVHRSSRLGRWRRWWRSLLSTVVERSLSFRARADFCCWRFRRREEAESFSGSASGSGSTAGISAGSATVECGRRMVRPRRWQLRRFPRPARRWPGAADTPLPCRPARPPRRRALLQLIPGGLIPRGRIPRESPRESPRASAYRRGPRRLFLQARRSATDPWRGTRGRCRRGRQDVLVRHDLVERWQVVNFVLISTLA